MALFLQKPAHHLLKDLSSVIHHDISVARHDILDPPGINPLDALRKRLAITGAVPEQSFLPDSIASGMHDPTEDLGQNARGWRHVGARVLLCGWQIEQQIGFDQRRGGLVEEDQLAVGVRLDVLVGEVGVEGLVDLHVQLVLLGEDCVKGHIGDGIVTVGCLGALLGEAFRTNDLGLRESVGPAAEEDVVLDIGRNEVGDGCSWGERLEFGSNGRGECDGGEDGEGVVGEFY